MSEDMSEMYRDLRSISQEKRKNNRESSAEILTRNGVAFRSHNYGAHMHVEHLGKTADFWPGTGKYQIHGEKSYKRGVFNLLRDLGVTAI